MSGQESSCTCPVGCCLVLGRVWQSSHKDWQSSCACKRSKIPDVVCLESWHKCTKLKHNKKLWVWQKILTLHMFKICRKQNSDAECQEQRDKTSSQAQHQVEGGLLLDVVVRKGAAILQLLACKDQALLVRWDPLLVLDLGLDIVNGVTGLDVEGDGLARQGLHEDLHGFAFCEFLDLFEKTPWEDGLCLALGWSRSVKGGLSKMTKCFKCIQMRAMMWMFHRHSGNNCSDKTSNDM